MLFFYSHSHPSDLLFSYLSPPIPSVVKQPFLGTLTYKYCTCIIEFIALLLILSAILVTCSVWSAVLFSPRTWIYISIITSDKVLPTGCEYSRPLLYFLVSAFFHFQIILSVMLHIQKSMNK